MKLINFSSSSKTTQLKVKLIENNNETNKSKMPLKEFLSPKENFIKKGCFLIH